MRLSALDCAHIPKPRLTPKMRVRGMMLLALLLAAILPAGSANEKKITVYSAISNYSLPVTDRNSLEYVGLLEVIEPLGRNVNSRTDGLRWKLHFNDADAEFTAGKSRAKVRGRDVDLPGNFLLESGRGLVPLTSLGTLLPRLLGTSITFNPGSRRLFVGNVATHFTAQLSRTTPPRLVMNFSAPVNPTIATEPGRLRMSFNREPVVAPGTPTLTFDDAAIPSAVFSENNGAAEIAVNGTAPLMASFSNDGRTITIAPAPQQMAAPSAPAGVPGAAPATPSAANPSSAAAPGVRRFFAVVDASHGGDDRGAALSDKLAEKDVTLALARRLRQELESRGMSTLVLRDSDANLTFDQRAVFTNTAHPTVYIALHAASDGKGVRLYTAMIPAGGENNGPFVAWDTAQTHFLPASQIAAQGVASELARRQIQVRTLVAPVRPLNNLIAAAIAVEVAPPGTDVMDLNLPAYQQNVVSAVANGLLAVRDRLGVPQ
jgi:N-acetylmuramoyl-L-alanine amidase